MNSKPTNKIDRKSNNPTKNRRAWLLPEQHNQQIRPGLYIVPTPIGNLRDITIRALDVLNEADIVLCEDTRVSGKLLEAYGLRKKLMVYNDHNAARQRPKIQEYLQANKILAQISDAGTPLISDPGFRLVDLAIAEGAYVTALPGANAPLPALVMSSLPTDNFTFVGFMPTKSTARQTLLKTWAEMPTTLIAFDTGKRISKTLKDIATVLGDRPIAVVREISKLYEEAKRGTAEELMNGYDKNGVPKGEITLLIGPGQPEEVDLADLKGDILNALKSSSKKDVTAHYTQKTGLPKKVVYEFILALSMES